MDELTALFAQPDAVGQLVAAKSDVNAYATLPAGFVQAWKTIDTIESLATFLFAAVTVQRPSGMSLAGFLHVGMALRAATGIDTLERGLKIAPQSKAQEQLRNYAMQALRRTQQRLLMQVMAQGGDPLVAVRDVAAARGLTGYAPVADLEQAMLDVWTLSEGSSPERLAA